MPEDQHATLQALDSQFDRFQQRQAILIADVEAVHALLREASPSPREAGRYCAAQCPPPPEARPEAQHAVPLPARQFQGPNPMRKIQARASTLSTILAPLGLIGARMRPFATAISLSGVVLVFAGVLLMHDQDAVTLWPGIPVGVLADVFPNSQWVLFGTVLLLAGGLLVTFSEPGLGRNAGIGCTGEPSPGAAIAAAQGRWFRVYGTSAAAAALLLYLYVLVQAPSRQVGSAVLLCLLVAAILATFALKWLAPGQKGARPLAVPGLDWIDLLAICLAIAAFAALMLHDVRYWFYAFWGDEWAFFAAARDLLGGHAPDLLSQSGVYSIHPWANSAYTALIMHVVGMNVTGWRLSSVLSAMLAIPPLYLLGRRLGGRATAVASAALYAGCHVLWAYCHIGYNNNDPLLVIVAAAALLQAGLRTGRPYQLFAAGALAGAAWYTLFTGRLMIGVLVLALLTERRGGWSAAAKRLLALLSGFTLVVLPLFVNNGLDTIRQMLPLVSLSQARTSFAVSTLLGQNTVRGLYEFFYATENTHYVVGAVFDVVSATCLCIGVVLAIRNLQDLGPRLLLIWFGIGLACTTPLYYAPTIADTRMQIAIPPAALLAGYGLTETARAIASVFTTRARATVYALCVTSFVVAALALNFQEFYYDMPQQVQPTLLAMTIGGMQETPDRTTILAGAVANNNLCIALQGFEFDFTKVLRFQDGVLTWACPSFLPIAMNEPVIAGSSVQILIAPSQVADAAACGVQPKPLLVSPNGNETLWALSIAVPPGAAAVSAASMAQQVTMRCPALVSLPGS